MVLAVVENDEVEVFEQFKKAVSDLKQSDSVLIRFLRARNFNLNNAEQMLRNATKWREEIDIDNSAKWEFPDYYENELPFIFFGKDNQGSPTLWIPVGKWNGKTLVDNGEGENLLRWAFSKIERGLQIATECGSKGNVVVDLEGLTYSQATHIASLKFFYQGCQRLEQCYPELIKSVMIINAPWVFTIGWTFIKGIITRTTMDKIRIYGCNKGEWQTVMLDKFPVESILPELTKDINSN